MSTCTEDGRLILVAPSRGAAGSRAAFTATVALVDGSPASLRVEASFSIARARPRARLGAARHWPAARVLAPRVAWCAPS